MMSTKEFKRHWVSLSLAVSLGTLLLIAGYLHLLLELSPAQWRGFYEIVGAGFVLLFVLTQAVSRRMLAPIIDWLVAEERGKSTREQVFAGFRTVSGFPVWSSIVGCCWWSGGGLFVALAMKFFFPGIAFYPLFVVWMAATSGGLVSSIVLYFLSKYRLHELLGVLADRIGDVEERGKRVVRVSLRQKVTVTVTAVTLVVVSFGLELSLSRSIDRLEENAVRVQRAYLRELGPGPGAENLEGAAERARRLAIADQLVQLDTRTGEIIAGSEGLLSAEEKDWVMVAREGDSVGIDSENVFAWVTIHEPPSALVAISPASSLSGAGFGSVFLLTMAISALMVFGLAGLLSRDLESRTTELAAVVMRIGSGDLRHGVAIESEDELGDLGRAFEEMANGLRHTVSEVVNAVNVVDGVTGELSEIAADVAQGAELQNKGVHEAVRSMESLALQASGIAVSSRELNVVVEESSSSILELGAASDELNDTAGVLSSRVDEVSSSIEQMASSVGEVTEQAGVLSAAALETSSSMEEMAAAMREVDHAAEDAARLSRAAVESAEGGRRTVRESMDGMESIRNATSEAETVITQLGERVGEIGSILDVIDDVAEETNLLALNAAIIAAQAGEQGNAFSVVADEIKELADRVLASTKEIGDLIGSVQKESENAVAAISRGARSVEEGVDRSRQAGESLDEITRASRENGQRIHEIVRSVQEQSKAANHVVNMMERVSSGAEAIHHAGEEQSQANETINRSMLAMREVAQQLHATTEEQSRGGVRIRESIEGVRDAVSSIDGSLQTQTNVSQEVVGFLEEVSAGCQSNDISARRMSDVTKALLSRAEALRADVREFVLEDAPRAES